MTEVIKFFYALSDANTKELLESNAGGAELGFVCGKDQIIKALEDELLKMSVGEKKQIKILAADALGERDESLMQLLPKEQFAGIDLKIGMALIGQDESGQSVHATVVKIYDENVLLDYNHPYASKDLIFDVEITERRQADSDEELTGVVKTPHVCACGGGGHSLGILTAMVVAVVGILTDIHTDIRTSIHMAMVVAVAAGIVKNTNFHTNLAYFKI